MIYIWSILTFCVLIWLADQIMQGLGAVVMLGAFLVWLTAYIVRELRRPYGRQR